MRKLKAKAFNKLLPIRADIRADLFCVDHNLRLFHDAVDKFECRPDI